MTSRSSTYRRWWNPRTPRTDAVGALPARVQRVKLQWLLPTVRLRGDALRKKLRRQSMMSAWNRGACGAWASLFVVSALAAPAQAAPGDGVRVGEWRFEPSLATGFEYHSNVYLADGIDSPVVGAPAFVFNPRIDGELDDADHQVSLGAGYALKKFIDPAPKDPYQVQNLDRFSDLDANLSVNAFRRSVVGLRLDDRFSIQNTPSELQTSGVNANIVVTSNDLQGGAVFRPGSALEIGVLGMFGLDNYNVPFELLESYQDNPNLNNRASYGPMLKASWRFLPKTSVLLNGSVTWNAWRDNLVAAIGPETEAGIYGEFIGKPDSVFWRASTGLRGQITNKVGVELTAGYGQAYYDEETVQADEGSLPGSSSELDITGSDVNAETFARDLTSFGEGLLVNAQLAWKPQKGQAVILGYKKDFQDAFFTNYVAYNYGFLRYEGTFFDRLSARGEGSVRLDDFHGEVSRADINLKLQANLAYDLTTWLAVTGGGGWAQRACGEANCRDDQFYSSQYDDAWGALGVKATW